MKTLIFFLTLLVYSQDEYVTFPVEEAYDTVLIEPQVQSPLAIGEASHTPLSEVVRVINLLPKPEIAFVDFGCGYDARWCITAAERWGCKCVGVEINPHRARAARERVRNLGLSHLITIVEGDATEVQVSGDVGVAYLYPEMLVKLKPRLSKFKAFASYIHQPQGLTCTKNGDTWFYRQQVQQVQYSRATNNSGKLSIILLYEKNNPHPTAYSIANNESLWNGFRANGHEVAILDAYETNKYDRQININGGTPCLIILDRVTHVRLNTGEGEMMLPDTPAGVQAIVNKYSPDTTKKTTTPVLQSAAVWGGSYYSQPVCTSPYCAMCNSIRRQLYRR